MVYNRLMEKNGVAAEIIAVGSEILLGQIVNTNASYLSGKLSELGIDLFRQSVIGDNPGRVSASLKNALGRADIVITCGGLGPTVDDITMEAVAEAIGRPLALDPAIRSGIKRFFKNRHIKMPRYVSKQAYLPKGALSVKNPAGTAPGAIIECGEKTIVALPGPPRELIPIFEGGVIPYLKKRYRLRSTIFTRSIRTAGLPESYVNKKIRRYLMMPGPVTVGIYARPYEVDVKITAKAGGKEKALAQIGKVERKIVRILGESVYGFDDDTLELAAGKALMDKGMTLSIAESCTGGLISDRITNIPGSSKYFDRCLVTYSNRSKMRELGVSGELIKKHGAVSRPAAIAMAKGMLKKSGSDAALAVTGIAGPSGGTKDKPVGLVYIALAKKKGTGYFFAANDRPQKSSLSPFFRCIERHFIGSRIDIKYQASTAALEFLRKGLLK